MKVMKYLIFSGAILLGAGFTFLGATVYAHTGVSTLVNNDDFNVLFTKILIDGEDKTDTTISNNGKTISYKTKELQKIGDKSELDFEVTNYSNLYDVDATIECSKGENGKYYQVTTTMENKIESKKTKRGKIEVKKTKLATEDIQDDFSCTLNMTAREKM